MATAPAKRVKQAKVDGTQAVKEILAGKKHHKAANKLPVPVHALLAEALLEQGRDKWFDSHGVFRGSNFGRHLMEVLGCSSNRATSVATAMRRRGAYQTTGYGSQAKLTFHGTQEARDILVELSGERPAPAPKPQQAKSQPSSVVLSEPPAAHSSNASQVFGLLGQSYPELRDQMTILDLVCHVLDEADGNRNIIAGVAVALLEHLKPSSDSVSG